MEIPLHGSSCPLLPGRIEIWNVGYIFRVETNLWFNFHGFLRSVISLENSRYHPNKKRRSNKINPLSFVAH